MARVVREHTDGRTAYAVARDLNKDAAMARPLRCRLRLHRWEYRENPETHEHYQVCLRCNAYRDRGSSAFDGRGACGLGG